MGADESDHSSSITTSSHLMDSIAKKKCPHVFHIRSCLFIFCHPGNFGFFIFERWEMLGSNNFWQVVSHEIAVFFFLLPFIRNNSIRPLVWVPGSSLCFVIVTISSRLSLCLSEDEMWGKDEAIGWGFLGFFSDYCQLSWEWHFKICQTESSLEIRQAWRYNPVIYPLFNSD